MDVLHTPDFETVMRQRVAHLRSLLAVGLAQEQRGDLIDFTPEWEQELSRRVEERFLSGELPNPDACP